MNHQAPTPSLPLKTGITPRNFPAQGREHAYLDKGEHLHNNVGKKREPRLPSNELVVRNRSKVRLSKHLDKLSAQLSTRHFSERLTGRDGEYAVKTELKKVDRLRERLSECGTMWRVLTCGDHIQRQNLNHCDHRLCPFCAGRRSRKIQRKYLPKMGAFMRFAPVKVTPCFVTIALAHKDGESAIQSYKRLYDAFKKLIRRKRWKRYFLGGLWAFETILSKDGCWHSHLHIIAFRTRFVDDLDGLKADLLDITGDSHYIHIRPMSGLKFGMEECCKYMIKPSDFDRMTPDHIRQLLEFRGKRLINVFGEFADFCKTYEVTDEDREEWCDPYLEPLQDGDPCPHIGCGQPVSEYFWTFDEMKKMCLRIESRTHKARGRPPLRPQ